LPERQSGGLGTLEPPYGEARIATLLQNLLSGWGAKVDIRKVLPGRPNLIARFEGKSQNPVLMLEAHADTVAVDHMKIPPFEPAIRKGRLYGRGACDTKGSIAAMLWGIRKILDNHGRPPCPVVFVATCDEEQGARGAARLMEDGFRPDFAIVGEPTELAIVQAHKGAVRWRIRTLGVSGHSSNPSGGVNAISLMRRVLDVLEGPFTADFHSTIHPRLGGPTLSVGTIQGGNQVNIIPDRCEIQVDRRMIPGEEAHRLTELLRERLDALASEDSRFAYELEEYEHYPAFEQDLDHPFAIRFRKVLQQWQGEAKIDVAPWCANAGFFKQAGIPCLVFGPGSIRQAHTAEEYVELSQVEKASEILAEYILRFGQD
jgi:acetylornithine deacetylase